jgi:hypothetical protein
VNSTLNGRVDVQALEGDLWKFIQLRDISVLDAQQDTVGSIDSISIRYDVWSLLGDAFIMDSIGVAGANLRLTQDSTSWNLLRLVKESDPADTLAESEPFNLEVAHWTLDRSNVEIQLLDSLNVTSWRIANIQAGGSAGYLGGKPRFRLEDLAMQVDSPKFPRDEVVEVQVGAQWENSTFNLDQLVLGAGATLLQAQGNFNLNNDSLTAHLESSSFDWQTVARLATDIPAIKEQTSQFVIELAGQWPELSLELEAQSPGLDSAYVFVHGRWDSTLTIYEAAIDVQHFKAEQLLEPEYAFPLDINQAEFNWRGDFPLMHIHQGVGQLQGNIQGVRYGDYQLDQLTQSLNVSGDSLIAQGSIHREGERINWQLDAQKMFDAEQVTWSGEVQFAGLDPTYWSQDNIQGAPISGSLRASGDSYDWELIPFRYGLELEGGEIEGQPYSRLALSGSIFGPIIRTNGSLTLDKSKIAFEATGNYREPIPDYAFEARSDNLNLQEIQGMDSLETQLRPHIYGRGSGTDLANLRLQTTISMDSSIVNRERIDTFHGQLVVEDTLLKLTNAQIRSPIADGTLSLRQHLTRPTDINNRLQLDILLKDLQSLAPLAGTDLLQAQGTVKGSIFPELDGQLGFEASVDLKQVGYGTTVKAEGISGRVNATIVEEPTYFLSLVVQEPSYEQRVLQDMEISTSGQKLNGITTGEAEVRFRKDPSNQLRQSFTYRVTPDTTHYVIRDMEIIDPGRNLVLQEPVNGWIFANAFQMDTLKVMSTDSVSLTMNVPYLGSDRQRFYLSGQAIDVGALQKIVMDEAVVEGILDGFVELDRTERQMDLKSSLQLSQLTYQDVALDTVRLAAQIDEQWASLQLHSWMDQQEVVRANLECPLLFNGAPDKISDSLSQAAIAGMLQIHPLALEKLKPWLDQAGYTDTRGELQFLATLSGSVGAPELEGQGSLRSGSLSGVQVDSLALNMDYDHDQALLQFGSSIYSLNQKALDADGHIPFQISLRDFDVQLPTQNDPIHFSLITNEFNMAALNDFVDRGMVRNLKGFINGTINIDGTYGEPVVDGQMSLGKGSVDVVEAGITVEKIKTELKFQNDQLLVEEGAFYSSRGRGILNGSVQLDGLVPTASELRLQLTNFQAFNTRDINATISADASLTGPLAAPRISGDLEVNNGFIYMRNFGEKSVETIALDELDTISNYQLDLYDSLSIDMAISFDRRFYVRNRQYLDMEIELDGELNVQKPLGEELNLFGTLSAAEGYARPLGKQFNIENGTITFSGNPYNPRLNIRTLYRPPQPEDMGEVRIWYIIEGLMEEPEFRYESEPQMELENIISYTLFGKPYYALQSWEQVVTNTGADQSKASVALDVLLDQVESLATQRLGIDVVKIDNNTTASGAGTTIKTGWYINEKVFFAVLNEINGSAPNTSFIIEYMITKNLDLILMQGDNNRTGIDIRWKYDY